MHLRILAVAILVFAFLGCDDSSTSRDAGNRKKWGGFANEATFEFYRTVEVADKALNEGHYDSAIAHYSEALRSADQLVDQEGMLWRAYEGRARANCELGNYTAAISDVEIVKARSLNRENSTMEVLKGDILRKSGDLEGALKSYQHAVELALELDRKLEQEERATPNWLHKLALVNLSTERYEEAIHCFTTLISDSETIYSDDPSFPERGKRARYHWNRGVTYQKMGDSAKANLDFDAARSLDSSVDSN